jgi:hypothetical protein
MNLSPTLPRIIHHDSSSYPSPPSRAAQGYANLSMLAREQETGRQTDPPCKPAALSARTEHWGTMRPSAWQDNPTAGGPVQHLHPAPCSVTAMCHSAVVRARRPINVEQPRRRPVSEDGEKRNGQVHKIRAHTRFSSSDRYLQPLKVGVACAHPSFVGHIVWEGCHSLHFQ